MRTQSLDFIFKALDQAGVRYVVVGGFAVMAHGYLRTTRDLDLVIGLAPENIKRGLGALESIGYRMAIPVTKEQFADAEQRDDWRKSKQMIVLRMWSDEHRATPIDIFVYEPFDFDAELDQALKIEWNERIKIPVVSLPSLLRMKREAGRPQDLADIQELESLK